jgi:hypothetical protein
LRRTAWIERHERPACFQHRRNDVMVAGRWGEDRRAPLFNTRGGNSRSKRIRRVSRPAWSIVRPSDGEIPRLFRNRNLKTLGHGVGVQIPQKSP